MDFISTGNDIIGILTGESKICRSRVQFPMGLMYAIFASKTLVSM